MNNLSEVPRRCLHEEGVNHTYRSPKSTAKAIKDLKDYVSLQGRK